MAVFASVLGNPDDKGRTVSVRGGKNTQANKDEAMFAILEEMVKRYGCTHTTILDYFHRVSPSALLQSTFSCR